jgi:deoxycytidylate deaminase
MKKQLLDHFLQQCRRTLQKHPQYENFPHWTFLVRDNQVISVGMNRKHEPSKVYGYHNLNQDEDFKPKWHSELDAVIKNRRGFKGIVNVRLNKLGQTRISMPCKVCRGILTNLNVKKIFFTTESQWGQL